MNQKQKARELFFQSDMTRTDIAEKLGVSRRTIYQWSVDGNWDKLRQSARNMPVMLAEKVYYLIGHLTDQMLQKDPLSPIVTKDEVNMLAKLTNIVGKLRKGSTVSENMETFNYLLERINSKDPILAEMVTPHISEYIEDRSGKTERDFLLSGFTEKATLSSREDDLMEKWLDEENEEEEKREKEERTGAQPEATVTDTPDHAPVSVMDQLNALNARVQQTLHSLQPSTGAQNDNSAKRTPKSIFSHYRSQEKKPASLISA